MRTLLEGVSVVVQPCTLVIALPTVALVLAAHRRAAIALAASILSTAVMMWARAAGYWTLESSGAAIIVISLLVGAGFTAVVRSRNRRFVLAGSATCGAVVGWLWQPCVGEQLADILNQAAADRPASLARMIVYTAGALLPAIVLAAAPHAWAPTQAHLHGQFAARIGAMLGAVYALALVSGGFDDLVGELSRWSTA